jgi:hypothetical protein
MSFSGEVKEELSKLNTFGRIELVRYEILGYLLSANSKINKNKIVYSTTNEYNINRFGKMLNKIQVNYNIKMQGNNFLIILKNFDYLEYIKNLTNSNLDEKRALLRGSFMGGGLINNPNQKYHLEILFNSEENQKIIKKILDELEINVKELDRKKTTSLYIKEGETISNFLAIIGANTSVVRYEEIRVLKEKKNHINRIVNCETSNLNKTIRASVRQIEAIKKMKKNGKYEGLTSELKEIANLRLENPDMSLAELGKMLEKPIGKSGVNHRMEKIIKISEE